ncbi:phosphate-binding protein of phosphonate ABC transporter [Patulibacter medicamentivorans]|uniref:Phosphate-binding protein of phosphonate ABC transporter n=1 Tax=Patulibacter medicamentivorans TaxID=1097667 RepID=H0E443_9ACTN|nr:PhnD/SsuA/transferrin family substrate-binding protein [Patulibacter medicamentivorans]EHN11548.1 phosphate-binding protein of phosphonate ABC transporter [Patulibacter medicamentivorans]
MSTSAVRPSPRLVALLLVLAVAVAAAGLALVPGSGARADGGAAVPERFDDGSCTKTAIRVGFALDAGDGPGRAAADRFAHDLSDLVACPVEVVLRDSQKQLLLSLALHQIDLAQLDPEAVVVADRVAAVDVVGMFATGQEIPARQAPARIWVRDGSRVRTVADLRRRTLAIGEQLTAGGDLLPRRALQAAGLRAGDVSLRRIADDGDALRAVRRGQVDAAVTRLPVGPAEAAGLRALWTSTPVLADALAIRPGVRSKVRRLVVAAARALTATSLGPLAEREGIQHVTALTSVPLDLYAPLAVELDALTAAGQAP